MHMERKLRGNELGKAITRQGRVNDENISPTARNDNFALSLQFIPNFGLSLHFIPSLQSAVCILYLVCILYPVCSLQSAVCSLHFILTVLNTQCSSRVDARDATGLGRGWGVGV